MPLREEIKDSLIRQGMQKNRGPSRKMTGKKAEKGTNVSFSESTQMSLDSKAEHAPHLAQQHKSTFHNVHFHCAKRVDSPAKAQTSPAHIPHSMLREVKVHIAGWQQRSTPVLSLAARARAKSKRSAAHQSQVKKVWPCVSKMELQ